MGYYTDYYLDVEPMNEMSKSDNLFKEIEKKILDIGVFEGGNINDGFWGNAKWYDYCKDMSEISSIFHDVLFTLRGDGEERDDMWIAYFLNGKAQFCPATITYEPIDYAKLGISGKTIPRL